MKMEDLVEFFQGKLEKDFGYDDDYTMEMLQVSSDELRRAKMDIPPKAKDTSELPKLPFGLEIKPSIDQIIGRRTNDERADLITRTEKKLEGSVRIKKQQRESVSRESSVPPSSGGYDTQSNYTMTTSRMSLAEGFQSRASYANTSRTSFFDGSDMGSMVTGDSRYHLDNVDSEQTYLQEHEPDFSRTPGSSSTVHVNDVSAQDGEVTPKIEERYQNRHGSSPNGIPTPTNDAVLTPTNEIVNVPPSLGYDRTPSPKSPRSPPTPVYSVTKSVNVSHTKTQKQSSAVVTVNGNNLDDIPNITVPLQNAKHDADDRMPTMFFHVGHEVGSSSAKKTKGGQPSLKKTEYRIERHPSDRRPSPQTSKMSPRLKSPTYHQQENVTHYIKPGSPTSQKIEQVHYRASVSSNYDSVESPYEEAMEQSLENLQLEDDRKDKIVYQSGVSIIRVNGYDESKRKSSPEKKRLRSPRNAPKFSDQRPQSDGAALSHDFRYGPKPVPKGKKPVFI